MLRKRGLTTRFFFTVCNHQRAVLSIYRSNNDTAKRTVAMRCSRSYTIDVLRPCRMFITLASHGDNDNFLFSCLLQPGAERASSYSLFSFFLFFFFFSFFFFCRRWTNRNARARAMDRGIRRFSSFQNVRSR